MHFHSSIYSGLSVAGEFFSWGGLTNNHFNLFMGDIQEMFPSNIFSRAAFKSRPESLKKFIFTPQIRVNHSSCMDTPPDSHQYTKITCNDTNLQADVVKQASSFIPKDPSSSLPVAADPKAKLPGFPSPVLINTKGVYADVAKRYPTNLLEADSILSNTWVYPYADYLSHIEQNTDEWMAVRKRFKLTASALPAAIGVDIYKTPAKLYRELKDPNYVPNVTEYAVQMMDYGKRNEAVAFDVVENFVAQHWDMGLKLTGIWIYMDDDRIGASPDGLIVNPRSNTILGVLEIKCPASGNVYEGLYEGAEVKLPHLVQMHAQMAATKTTFGIYCVWTPKVTVLVRVPYNAEFWDIVKGRAVEFMRAMRYSEMPRQFRRGERMQLFTYLRSILAKTPTSIIAQLVTK